MTQKEIILLINKIESEFPVHTLTYKGIKVWPMIRLSHVFYRVISTKEKEKREKSANVRKLENKLGTPINFIKNGLGSILKTALFDRKNNLKSNNKSKYLSILQTTSRQVKINGTHFSSIINGLDHFLDAEHAILEFNFFYPVKIPRFGSSKMISAWLTFDYLCAEFITLIKPTKNQIKNLKNYQTYLEKEGIKAEVNEQFLLRYLNRIFLFKARFLKLLKNYEPKIVFFIASYDPVFMGAILACNELGIPTVDIQHGITGNFHTMYTHWENLPKEGYEILPKYYWVWGDLSERRLIKWIKNNDRHQTVLGGNPWFAYCKDKMIEYDEDRKTKFEKLIAGKKRIILVSLQFLEDFKQSCLIQAMKKEDDQYLWLVRMHPRINSQMPDLQQFLANNGCKNYEMTLSNELSIYYLFKKVNFQVAFWSTTIVEALSFDVGTIVIHENGYDLMEEYIEKGIIKYTKDPIELIAFIEENEFAPEGDIKYIETNPKIIQEAIQKIIK